MRLSLVAPGLLLLLVACGTPIDPENAWTEVGVGEASFESIDDGAVMQVERGSQGGMHIWVSMRAWGIDPGPKEMWQGLRDGTLPLIGFEIESPEGILTPDNVRPYVLTRSVDEYLLLENLVTFDHFPELPENWEELDFEEVEAALEQADIRLRVSLVDALGTVVEDTRSIRLVFPPRPSDEEEEEEEEEELG